MFTFSSYGEINSIDKHWTDAPETCSRLQTKQFDDIESENKTNAREKSNCKVIGMALVYFIVSNFNTVQSTVYSSLSFKQKKNASHM